MGKTSRHAVQVALDVCALGLNLSERRRVARLLDAREAARHRRSTACKLLLMRTEKASKRRDLADDEKGWSLDPATGLMTRDDLHVSKLGHVADTATSDTTDDDSTPETGT